MSGPVACGAVPLRSAVKHAAEAKAGPRRFLKQGRGASTGSSL